MILDLFRHEVVKNIQGYDDVKDAPENYNVLLCGPPASAKTLFLLGVLECRKFSILMAQTPRLLDGSSYVQQSRKR